MQLDQQDVGPGTGTLIRRQAALERLIRDRRRLLPDDPLAPPPRPVAVPALGHSLADRALVEFVQHRGTLHALTVAGGRLRLRALGPVTEIAGLVDRLLFGLHRLARRHTTAQSRGAAEALLWHATGRLDDALLRPLPELDDRPLVIVPTGRLHGLPWSILPSCAGRPVTVSPSSTLWHATNARLASTGTGTGTGHTGPDSPPASAVAVAAGPGLPHAADEARAVAAIHRTTALLDGAATVPAVLAALGTATLAHLAAHGRLTPHNPLFSDLRLTDGPLMVYDLEQLAHAPHTVVLAACDTARSVICLGDELLGLGAAFISRGTAQLIAPVIPIPDAETGPLMLALHDQLAGGRSPAAALAAAQAGTRREHSPAFAAAAAFICIGHGFTTPPLPTHNTPSIRPM
jgi:CHAT domain-containing protein